MSWPADHKAHSLRAERLIAFGVIASLKQLDRGSPPKRSTLQASGRRRSGQGLGA